MKSVLKQNGYPTRIKLLLNFSIKVSKNGSPLPQFLKKTLHLVLAYVVTQSLILKRKLNKLFKEQLPSGKFEIVFRTIQGMLFCFKFKDANPYSLLSGVIYEHKYSKCNSRYIGSTY